MHKMVLFGLACTISCGSMASELKDGLYFSVIGGVGVGKVNGFTSIEPGAPSVAAGINTTHQSGLFGAAIGYSLANSPFDIELQVMRLNQQRFKLSNLYQDGFYELDTLNIKSNVYLLNGLYSFTTIHKFTPFIGAGIGFAQNKVSGDYDGKFFKSNINDNGVWPEKSKTNFAYAIKAGLNYQLTDKFSTSLVYQYMSLGKLSNDMTSGGPQTISADQFASNNFLVSLVYKL